MVEIEGQAKGSVYCTLRPTTASIITAETTTGPKKGHCFTLCKLA